MDELRAAVLYEVLAKGPDVRRAALSWHLVKPGLKGIKLLKAWSRASGVGVDALEDIEPMLRLHRICLDDRSLDADAGKILKHFAADGLRRLQDPTSKRRPPKR